MRFIKIYRNEQWKINQISTATNIAEWNCNGPGVLIITKGHGGKIANISCRIFCTKGGYPGSFNGITVSIRMCTFCGPVTDVVWPGK